MTAVNGSSFTFKVGQTGSSMTFNTDGTTQFKDGVTSVASLLNQVVTVEGFTRADGSLFAKEIEGLESNTGAEVEGLITAISGTTLTVNAHDGIGNGFDDTKIGASFSVNIAGLNASKFRVKAGNGFGGGLPSATFPFDATTIHQGQRIEVDTNAAVPPASGAITPDKINLQQQGVSGVVANAAASTFDINLATDSASENHLRTDCGSRNQERFNRQPRDCGQRRQRAGTRSALLERNVVADDRPPHPLTGTTAQYAPQLAASLKRVRPFFIVSDFWIAGSRTAKNAIGSIVD